MILLILFTGVYVLFTLLLWWYWTKIKVTEYYLAEPVIKVSVIIPVRNEEATIGNLLADLDQQTYRKEYYEVIVVNDNSTDRTAEIVESLIKRCKTNLRLMHLDNIYSTAYKKKALQLGISNASGELILTTDGDCRVRKGWIASFVTCYQGRNAKLISGPVRFIQQADLFSEMQTIEFASLIGGGAASMSAGYPAMCNGANLAFSKEAFWQVGAYAGSHHIASGDDEHLMHKIKAKYPSGLVFLKDKNAIVSTTAQPNVKAFLHQRIRWAGKWKYNKNVFAQLFAVFLFLYHFLLLAGPIFILYGQLSLKVYLLIVFFKFLVERLYLQAVIRFLEIKFKLFPFLLLQLIYPVYVVFFGVLANISKKYYWKGRQVEKAADKLKI